MSWDYLSLILKLIISIVIVGVISIVYHVVQSVIKRQIRDATHMHMLRMLLRNSFFVAGSVIVLIVWLGGGSNLTVAVGILGAGVAFASQEVIGSFAGYLSIVSGGMLWGPKTSSA